MVAVISTYLVLVMANVLLFRGDGNDEKSKDILEPRCKKMDKESIQNYYQ